MLRSAHHSNSHVHVSEPSSSQLCGVAVVRSAAVTKPTASVLVPSASGPHHLPLRHPATYPHLFPPGCPPLLPTHPCVHTLGSTTLHGSTWTGPLDSACRMTSGLAWFSQIGSLPQTILSTLAFRSFLPTLTIQPQEATSTLRCPPHCCAAEALATCRTGIVTCRLTAECRSGSRQMAVLGSVSPLAPTCLTSTSIMMEFHADCICRRRWQQI